MLVRMIDCYVLPGIVCVGWTMWEVVDFCLSWELEFFGSCLW